MDRFNYQGSENNELEAEFGDFNEILASLLEILRKQDYKTDLGQLTVTFSDQLKKVYVGKNVRNLSQAKAVTDFCRGPDWLRFIQAVRAIKFEFAEELLDLRNRLVKAYNQITDRQKPDSSGGHWMINGQK